MRSPTRDGDFNATEMHASTQQAFVGSPLAPCAFFSRNSPLHVTPRRTRVYVQMPQARSLESYREGNRFGNEGRSHHARRKGGNRIENADSKSGGEFAQGRGKQSFVLPYALVRMNVASFETCGFLVRSGCVRVNGSVVKDEKAKINRFNDIVTVNGTEYGCLDERLREGTEVVNDENEKDELNVLPRTQRDFYHPESARTPGMFKKYNRGVDGGFYSSRRHKGGK